MDIAAAVFIGSFLIFSGSSFRRQAQSFAFPNGDSPMLLFADYGEHPQNAGMLLAGTI
jgi:hypothetical protein